MKDDESKILVSFTSAQMKQMEEQNELLIKSNKNLERAVLFQSIIWVIGIIGLVVVAVLLYSSLHDNQYLSRGVAALEQIAANGALR